jgi:hypothetical protein
MKMRTTDAIYRLLLHDRTLSVPEIEEKLSKLGFPSVTRFCLYSLRTKLLHILKLLEEVDAIEPNLSVPLPRELRLKRRKTHYKLDKHWATRSRSTR